MARFFKHKIVYIWASLSIAFVFNIANFSYAQSDNEEKLSLLTQCAKEESALTRLECYDNVLRSNMAISLIDNQSKHSQIWQWIVDQESQRLENNTDFIINDYESDERVLLTTPAIGHMPPRPILAFSCVDKITRMQIVLFKPMNYKNTKIKLVTNNNVIDTNWFIRDGGFIFESSRGLLGIEQIKKILSSNSLTLTSDEPMLNGLVFNLNNLDVSIKPLRKTCHW